ncbi:acyl-CoA dehydratase activase [Sporomusa acidovorans]|uniref:2-hydroxyisocaproyl-CoA dehydratase activator n=1 Tax=Sporomusa acidovorans (strain ATCC 49682 / DSM 3132 / Mol) TaxID=1123286 RepID=A0ABZ3IZQ0_SPOA4|nr:acyl-CoA dehydratase activase [Sporomusa acidovorans]OZC17281.1 R-phenyllactate dehydratase activator [Sporomusa acidovorans DSM 3132]SDF16479.1 CoA-substrate-specific enzyme activase, putative [Sporomusa acidovorans]
MKQTVVAGIDAGSSAIKLSLYDGVRVTSVSCPSGWNPREQAAALLKSALAQQEVAAPVCMVGTGYGRFNLPFVTKAMTEITCHARGAAYLLPEAKTVIDIGGQDAKAIRIDGQGKVQDFVMNDKCAAGTGRFLQVTANALGLDVAEIGRIDTKAASSECTINSMCTVFAESEVIGLVNRGIAREAIIAALYVSIANRVAAMAAGIQPAPPAAFTGGLAQNQALRTELATRLGLPVITHDQAVFAGSIGAALFAWDAVQVN